MISSTAGREEDLMRTIKEARKNVMSLWPQAKPVQTKYRLMKYLLDAETEDGLLLYNVVTSALVLLDKSEAEMVKSLPREYSSEMDQLIAEHFVVKEDYDESKLVQELRAVLLKLDVPERITGFTILPTTECNARCFYCFESNHKHCTMTEELASDVINYIVTMSKSKGVNIGWFGGEPLVAHKRISQICSALREKRIEFSSSMVSNGYLFDPELIQTAKTEWNLGSVQITLDGTEDIYNNTKAYVNPGENPYRRVLRNIGHLLENGIGVNIRLNVTDKNAADLSDLIEKLALRFGGKKGFSCYAHAVYEDVGFEPLSYDDAGKEQVDSQTVILDAKLKKLGLLGSLARLPYLRTVNCMADNDSCRLIYPDGTVGKCEDMPSEKCIGDIYSDVTDLKMNELYKTAMQPDQCKNCFLFPYCMNLKLCPETGRCSGTKVEWKKQRYRELMKTICARHEAAGSGTESDSAGLVDCGS